MALVICSGGQISLVTLMLKTVLEAGDPGWTIHLFNNNYTPVLGSTAENFTETSFSGYSSVAMTRSTWQTATTSGSVAQIQFGASPVTWTCTGSGDTIYGAYILDGSNNLLWAELFTSPRTLASGDVLNYTPVMTLGDA
jgi:hypothetical protein